ncbi:MAG TPA: ABC transporter permease [Steroidobacteraceae bacterium]|nr:ABC transporter permease [Steroidobacteraceae bacterium]
MAGSYFDSRREGETLELALRGDWRAAALAAIRAEQSRLDLAGVRRALITAPGPLDLAGAWVLDELTRELAAREILVEFPDGEPRTLVLVRSALVTDAGQLPAALRAQAWENPVGRLGRTTVERVADLRSGLVFVGRATLTQLAALRHWRRLRPISIARHVYDTGITAIPIVALIAFLISVIIAYLSASQLRNYGADIYTVDLITVGVLRELGVLLTAIIVAGRTGSAFAAELGSMKLNEEVDALDATGVDPVETLVLPRVIGLVISLPLLTIIADLIGMAGGALLCQTLLDMPLQQFINRANEAIAPTTFWSGLIKAPVFALLIAMVGTYRGLQVRDSSRELGRLTTVAVVQSIFLVMLADALFAILYMKIDF